MKNHKYLKIHYKGEKDEHYESLIYYENSSAGDSKIESMFKKYGIKVQI